MPDYLAPPDLPTGGKPEQKDQIEEAEFSSTNVSAGRYDANKGELVLTFSRGHQYLYRGVSKEAWEGLKLAGSAGGFFRSDIMSLPFERLS